MDPRGSEGDEELIFFTVITYKAIFISDILLYNCRNWKLLQTVMNVEILM